MAKRQKVSTYGRKYYRTGKGKQPHRVFKDTPGAGTYTLYERTGPGSHMYHRIGFAVTRTDAICWASNVWGTPVIPMGSAIALPKERTKE